MPQVYATVYNATSVLVFTKNEQGRFFEGHAVAPQDLHGGGKCCFPGGGLEDGDFGPHGRPAHPTPAQWNAARMATAIREFREETGMQLNTVPISFTNGNNASCHFFPLPAGVTLAQVQAQIAAELVLANGANWQQAVLNGTLHIRDNEQAAVAIVPWANLPGAQFPVLDDDVDWFRGFVGSMKAHLHIP